MKRLLAVVRREYLQRVKSKWFLMSTLAAPAFLVVFMVAPMLYGSSRENDRRNLALVDRTGRLANRLEPRLEEAGFNVEVFPPESEDSARARALGGRIGGYMVLGEDALTRGHSTFYGSRGPGALRSMAIRDAVVQAALEERLAEVGAEADLDALFRGGSLDLQILEDENAGAREDEPRFIGVLVGAMLLYMVVLMYAQAVMRSALEEKTGRIVEILVSSIRPWELMLGKILGVGSVGLTQLAVWIALGTLGLTLGVPALVAARPGLADAEAIAGALPGMGLVGLFLALFLGGYFLYAALYAAVGAMCSTEEEAQQAQLPVVLILVIPVLLMMPIMEDPHATGSVLLSLVPFFSPVLLYARAGAAALPAWQIVLSLAFLYLGVWATGWAAGRIYRVGILMQGKRPTLPELWRWVKEA